MGLKRRILGFFTFLFITIFSAHAMAVEYPFIMTTTPDTTEFSFQISAAGTFYIDWGDGKTETIEKTSTGNQTISHTYSTANEYVIKLGGQATGYDTYDPAISFYENQNLAKINFKGSLDYELLCPSGDENCEEVARAVYNQACELEEMINRYKK